jgi:hypothetical protein
LWWEKCNLGYRPFLQWQQSRTYRQHNRVSWQGCSQEWLVPVLLLLLLVLPAAVGGGGGGAAAAAKAISQVPHLWSRDPHSNTLPCLSLIVACVGLKTPNLGSTPCMRSHR